MSLPVAMQLSPRTIWPSEGSMTMAEVILVLTLILGTSLRVFWTACHCHRISCWHLRFPALHLLLPSDRPAKSWCQIPTCDLFAMHQCRHALANSTVKLLASRQGHPEANLEPLTRPRSDMCPRRPYGLHRTAPETCGQKCEWGVVLG